MIMTVEGTRYRCGSVLVVAESGALKGFTIHCRRCDRYNEVPL